MKNEVNCLAHSLDQSFFDRTFATRMLNLWIQAKVAFVKDRLTVAQFRDRLLDSIIAETRWEEQFRDAYEEAGGKPCSQACTKAYRAYVRAHREEAIRLVPYGLHTEFRWIPGWTFGGLDEVMETHGLRSEKYKSNYWEDIIPGEWLARFLRLVNVSSIALEAALTALRPAEVAAYRARTEQAKFFVASDATRPALITPKQVITIIENAYTHAVPVVHAEIEVRTLLELDPSQPLVLTSKRGEVSLGFHCFVNGAGYMDTYPGEIVIPAGETGFTAEDRWSYGIDDTYGLYRPAFHTTPKSLSA